MKIKLEPTGENDVDYPTVKITIPGDDANMEQVWELLIKPALLAWGFGEKTIEDFFQ